ncbi:MAG: restriction endonuclease subunit S [Methanofollis sp.]|nr:restriction endonuclease subunit S [Methanofollis sp.]
MSEFTMVRFSEMATQVKTKVKPAETDLDRYVGLEHLDPESLHIRRWGVPGDVTGEKIVVQKGDIIFGKRRAYQRKVAIADFDCICSAHAMVLQPKEDVIIRELFPFFLQSDLFMNRAVQISVGGLSPTINWKDLARQEFPLPPIEEQRRIAKVLWAAEDVIVKDEALVAEAEHYKQVMMRELFSKGIGHEEFREVKRGFKLPVGWKLEKIDNLSEVRGGLQKSKDRAPKDNPRRYLTVAHVQKDNIDFGDPRYFEVSDAELEQYRLEAGDVLVVEGNGNLEELGRSAIFNGEIEDCVYQNMIIRIRPKDDSLISQYVCQYLNSPLGHRSVVKNGMSSSGLFHLGVERLMKIEIPIPPLPEQRQIASILSAIDDTIAAARASVEASKALKMRLINQLLSPDEETA